MIGLYTATSLEVIVHFVVGKPSLCRVPKYIDIWLWPWQCYSGHSWSGRHFF